MASVAPRFLCFPELTRFFRANAIGSISVVSKFLASRPLNCFVLLFLHKKSGVVYAGFESDTLISG